MKYIVDHVVGLGKGDKRFSETAEIQNLTFPSAVDPNIPFDISYEAINLSPQSQTLFGYIQNLSTQQQIPGSYWEFLIPAGQSYFPTLSFPNGITEQFMGEAVLGHIEYPACEAIIDATECINAGCEWYDGACHTPGPPPGINWIVVGSIVAVGIGIAVIIAIKKRK